MSVIQRKSMKNSLIKLICSTKWLRIRKAVFCNSQLRLKMLFNLFLRVNTLWEFSKSRIISGRHRCDWISRWSRSDRCRARVQQILNLIVWYWQSESNSIYNLFILNKRPENRIRRFNSNFEGTNKYPLIVPSGNYSVWIYYFSKLKLN